LDLGILAHTGVFPRTSHQPVTSGPLELVKCADDGDGNACGLVQLRHSYEPSELYGDNYGYRSSLNSSMVQHLASIVSRAKSFVALQPDDLVVDIGSNDGTTLRLYGRTDLRLVGLDPSGRKFARYYPPYVQLIQDFFSAAKVQQHVGPQRARIITSIAMFYDLEAPMTFVQDVHDLLADDGVWIFEQSYLPTMVDMNAYDTICHEHLEYYGLKQIRWMLDRVGLKIVDVHMNAINGGSFQVIAARKAAPYPENTMTIGRMLAREQVWGIDELATYRAFRDRVYSHRRDLLHFIAALRRQNKALFGLGASTKGNVILQFCGLTAQDLPCIAEVNEDKFGCVTPQSGIPIVSEQEARARRPDAFLVLPWHFRDSIVKRERAFIEAGGQLVFPLPQILVTGGAAIEKAA
jgi:hypothetical protein